MSGFFGKDRRGFKLVFPQHRWDHVLERGHFDKVKGTFGKVMSAFENSTVVTANEDIPAGMRISGGPKVADERYWAWVGEWNTWVCFPVIAPTTPTVIGVTTIDPPLRIAWSAFPDLDATSPVGEVLWKWPPDPE